MRWRRGSGAAALPARACGEVVVRAGVVAGSPEVVRQEAGRQRRGRWEVAKRSVAGSRWGRWQAFYRLG